MSIRPRCCLCHNTRFDLEPSELPGSGFQCIDREACKQRVKDIVSAHKAFAEL